MSQNADQPTRSSEVQVFHLTMDNPEDQDELNRRLRKPGESDKGTPAKNRPATPSKAPGKEPGKTGG